MIERRLKVMFVCGTFAGGGAERVTSTLLGQLDRERFAPGLCLLRNKVTYRLPDDVPLTVVNDRSRSGLPQDIPLAQVAKYRPWVVWQKIKDLRRHIERESPDIVVSTIEQVNCVTGSALRKASVRPAWIARLGSNPTKRGVAIRWWTGWAYEGAAAIVGNSERLARAFSRMYPQFAHRAVSIRNPTDFNHINTLARLEPCVHRQGSEPLIISVGRLIQEKRLDILLESFARVRKRRAAKLWICGDGPLRPVLEADIKRRSLENDVKMLGFVENPYALLLQADLFVMTSDEEGLPNALIEAQAVGLPAVSTRCDYGPDEIIEDSATGFLVAPGDSSAIADAITKALVDDDRRSTMGSAAAERSRRLFDLTVIMPRWEQALLDVAKDIDRRSLAFRDTEGQRCECALDSQIQIRNG